MLTPYQRACKNALAVQNACNFSGVLASFAADMQAVYDHLEAGGRNGTAARATHPVAVLYTDKLADLQRRPGSDAYHEAYDFCTCVVARATTPDTGEELP